MLGDVSISAVRGHITVITKDAMAVVIDFAAIHPSLGRTDADVLTTGKDFGRNLIK